MRGFGPVLLFLLAATAIAAFGWWLERKRSEKFRAIADRLGLRYVEEDRGIPVRYGFLDDLRKGENRYAFNVLRGRYEGHPVEAFDYHYETVTHDSKGRRETHHHHLSYFLLEQEREFPELRIYPEGFLQRIGQMLGFDDIDFESAAFSRAFTVRSKEKKFAYDVCHTGMMEYLLAHRDLSIEIEHRTVAIGFPRRLAPEEIPGRLRQLVEIRGLFPEYLYRA